MRIFAHHLYEYKKGLRNLVLYTGNTGEKEAIEKKLKRENIDYYIQKNNDIRMNVFFGDSVCIKMIKQMKFKQLSNLTEEEDFILGIMLGYDRLKQCERYLERKQHAKCNSYPLFWLISEHYVIALPPTYWGRHRLYIFRNF